MPTPRGKTVWNRCKTGLLPIAGRSLARHPRPQVLQSHLPVAKGRKSVPLTGLRSGSRPGLARLPCPQVLQCHLPVAKQSSDRSLTRRPCPQVPQCHPRVARLSGTGVKPVFGRCPGRSSARQPCLQVPQGHLCVARPSSIDTLVTRPRPQALQCRLPVAKQSSIGSFVHEMGPFCGH